MGIETTLVNDHVRHVSTGRILLQSTPAQFTTVVGFKPRYIKVSNVSERVELEWFVGMNDNEALKTVAAGTRTKLTALAIIPTEDGFSVGLDTDLLPVHDSNGTNDNNLDSVVIA